MKKILTCTLLICMIISMFACTPNESGEEKNTEAPTAGEISQVPEELEPNIIDDGNKNIYEIYVPSFASSASTSKISGITDRLDYIKTLGYDSILLTSLHAEAFDAIDASLGTDADLDALAFAAAEKGLDIIVSISPENNSQGLLEGIDDALSFWLYERKCDGLNFCGAAGYALTDEECIETLRTIAERARSIKADAYLMAELAINDDSVIAKYYESGFDSFKIFTSADATGSIAGCLKIHNGEALVNLMLERQKTFGNKITTTYISDISTNNRPASYMSGIENIKMIAGLQMLMNGSVSTYYGDEIGMLSKGGDKTLPMYWTKDGADASNYLYAPADTQPEDANSIYSFYKEMLNLRNCLPSLARGEITSIELTGNKSVCLIQKKYGEETVTIAINLALPEDPTDITTGGREIEIKKSDFKYESVVGATCAYGASYEILYDEESESFALPPYSILILK